MVEPRRNPHPCVRALLSETGVLEKPGRVRDACVGFMAGIQPSVCPPPRVDLDKPKDASMVRQAWLEFIAGFVSGDTSSLMSSWRSLRRSSCTFADCKVSKPTETSVWTKVRNRTV